MSCQESIIYYILLINRPNTATRSDTGFGDPFKTVPELSLPKKDADSTVSSTTENKKEKKKTNNQSRSITGSLKILGKEFTGTQHRGIDDALNIYEIIKVLGF